MKNKDLTFFTIVTFLGILPHLQLFPLDVTVSGRWFYVSGFGLVGLIGVLLKKNWEYLIVIPILIFSVISFNRTFDFRNGLILYSRDIKYDKDNYNLENNLGVELFRVGKIEQSAYHFKRSIELNPDWWTAYNNLGAYYENKGEFEKALELYETSIEKGSYYLAFENKAKLLIKLGMVDEALEFLDSSIAVFPYNQNLKLIQETAKNIK